MSLDLTGLNLPASVIARVKHAPIEDFAKAVLERGLPGVPVVTKIPLDAAGRFILVRRIPEIGEYDVDISRRGQLDSADFAVHVYAEDPDGDEVASLISDAVVDVLSEAYLKHWSFEDLGSVNRVRMIQAPARVTDWATATGPVQYADLPTGDWRYEIRFRIRINPPRG